MRIFIMNPELGIGRVAAWCDGTVTNLAGNASLNQLLSDQLDLFALR